MSYIETIIIVNGIVVCSVILCAILDKKYKIKSSPMYWVIGYFTGFIGGLACCI